MPVTIPVIAADGARSTVVLPDPVAVPYVLTLPFRLPAILGTVLPHHV